MNEEEIFQAARRITDPKERQDFVEKACTGDTVLVHRIDKLLRVCSEDDTFLASPAVETVESAFDDPLELIGSQAGPYRLVELIGEGGFGLVFRGQQERPVRRSVAIKVIKPGMDSRQTLARFQAEQQALALMSHPHIAGIFDCGQTELGRPWFAMEFVPGISLTALADQHSMGVRERLDLMLDVCNAIEHAHQKGVIHRDLKPSNILVSRTNGESQLKVIDFGIAKAVQGSLSGGDSITQGACMMGTPLYMSPEQVSCGPHDVDTRSDIYSLGVILYELITGRTPLDRKRLASFSFDQAMSHIRENEPLRPSQFYRTTDAMATTSALNRGMTVNSLASICRRDLDWIVMKCLEKDRQRRYQTVSELRNDLQRYLSGEVVLAGPPSTLRQIRKLVHRHRTLFLVGASVVFTLVLGLALSLSQAIRATRAETQAQKEKELARSAEARAVEENQIAQAVTRFVMDDLLGQADIANQSQEAGRDPNISAKELVQRASLRVGNRFADQPRIEIAIRRTLSSAWLALGEITLAVEHARKAVELSEAQYQSEDRQKYLSIQVLAKALMQAEQAPEAIRLATKARDYFQATYGEDHIETLRAMGLLASALNTGGQLKESEDLLSQVYARRCEVLGAKHEETLGAGYNLATALAKLGKFSQAEEIFRSTLRERQQNQGIDHPEVIKELMALASVLQLQEKLEESEPFYQQATELARKLLGEDHPVTLSIANDLANLYSSTDREELAGQMYHQILSVRKNKLGEKHPATWDAMNNLAIFQAELGQTDEAKKLLEEVVRLRKETDGLAHPDTVLSLNNLAFIHHSIGDDQQAIIFYREAIEGAEQTLPKDHPQLITLQTNLAIALMATDRPDLAEPILVDTLAATRSRYGDSSKEVATTLGRMALVLHAQSKQQQAEDFARQQLAIRLEIHPNLWTTAWAKSLLGTILASQGQLEEARQYLVEGANFISQNRGEVPGGGVNNARQSLDWVIEYFEKVEDVEQVSHWRDIREATFPSEGQ